MLLSAVSSSREAALAHSLTVPLLLLFITGLCLADLPASITCDNGSVKSDHTGDGSANCESSLNFRPVIGVLAQDYYGSVAGKQSFIAASYVKWLEGAGARAMPIFVNQTEEYYDEVLKLVNGILFPGGGVHIEKNTGYGLTGRLLYKKILEKNEREFLPLWGTCLGMELALFAHNNGNDPRVRCASQDTATPLHFTNDPGRLFGNASRDIIKKLTTENVTVNYHNWCVTPADLMKTGLARDFTSLATNVDEHGLRFLSALEHKRFPIYLVQFHPEKVQYEWVFNKGHRNIPHTASAVSVSQYMAEFFVSECRRNSRKFPEENGNKLIYNYPATYTAPHSIYVQSYLFE